MADVSWNLEDNLILDAVDCESITCDDAARFFNYNLEGDCLFIINPANNATLEIKHWSQRRLSTLIRFTVLDDEQAANVLHGNGHGFYFATAGDDRLNVVDADHSDIHGLGGADRIVFTGASTYDGKHLHLYGDAGNDNLQAIGGYLLYLSGGEGQDSITLINNNGGKESYPGATMLYGNEGADIISVIGSSNIIVKGDDDANGNEATGNDVIRLFNASGSTVYGDAGEDVLTTYGSAGITLSGGKGSDTYKIMSKLTAKSNIVIDQSDAGAKDKDVLLLSKVSKQDVVYTMDGNDLCLETNDGKITIKDWQEHALNKIIFKDGVVRPEDIGVTVTQLQVVQSFMESLDNTVQTGFDAVDEAVAVCSNGLYSSFNDLISSYKNDVFKYSGSTVAQQEKFLLEYCGINLENEDTGAITGADAGGSTVKTAESIVAEPDGMTVADFTYNYADFDIIEANDYSSYIEKNGEEITKKQFYAVDVNGITLYWDESNWSSLGVERSVLEQIIGGVINAWGEAALNLDEESYGMSLDADTSTLQTLSNGKKGMQIYLNNITKGPYLAELYNCGTYFLDNSAITITTDEILAINTYYCCNEITDVNGNASHGQEYLDRTLAHEFVHALMAANINNFNKLPTFLKEGLAELVHGVDDVRRSEILDLTNTAYSETWTVSENGSTLTKTYDLEGLIDTVFNINGDNINLGNEHYGGGYLLMRYLAKQVSENTVKSAVGTPRDDTIYIGTATAGQSYTLYYATEADDVIVVYGHDNDVYGGGGDDQIIVNAGKDIISTGTTNDGSMNNIHGGIGKDTFVIGEGVEYSDFYGDDDDDVFYSNTGDYNYYHGGNGNDTFNFGYNGSTFTGKTPRVYGEVGNDIFNVNGGDSYILYGDEGDDVFDITDVKFSVDIYGAAGNDTFKINDDLSNNLFYAIIHQDEAVVSDVDVLQLSKIDKVNISYTLTSDGTLKLKDTVNDYLQSIQITDWNQALAQITFADGSFVSYDDLSAAFKETSKATLAFTNSNGATTERLSYTIDYDSYQNKVLVVSGSK